MLSHFTSYINHAFLHGLLWLPAYQELVFLKFCLFTLFFFLTFSPSVILFFPFSSLFYVPDTLFIVWSHSWFWSSYSSSFHKYMPRFPWIIQTENIPQTCFLCIAFSVRIFTCLAKLEPWKSSHILVSYWICAYNGLISLEPHHTPHDQNGCPEVCRVIFSEVIASVAHMVDISNTVL